MSRVLIVDGDGSGGYLLAGSSSRAGAAKAEKALRLPDLLALPGANPAEAGRVFREFLKANGVAPAPLVALVPRERLTLKEVRYPVPASANDEPTLVRFQAGRDLAEGVEAWAIDFCPVAEPVLAGGDRRSLAVMAKRDLVTQWRTFAEAAKLPLLGVAPRAFGQSAALERAVASGSTPAAASFDAPVAAVCRGDGWGELAVSRAGRVAFSRPLGAGAQQSVPGLAGELKRSFAAAAGQFGGVPVSSAYLSEPHGSPDVEQLGALLPITVRGFDPGAGLEGVSAIPRGLLAGMAGTLALAGSALPVNLSSPREPKPEADGSKRRVAVLVGLLVLAGLAAGYGVLKLRETSARLVELKAQKADLDAELVAGEEDAKRARAVDDWVATNVNALDEFYDTTDRFPDIKSARMTEWSLLPPPQASVTAKGPKSKFAARLDMKVATENRKLVEPLTQEMDRDGFYRVEPPRIKGATGTSTQFNQAFDVIADVMKRDPKQFTRQLKAKPPAPPEPGPTPSPESPNAAGGI